MQICADLTLMTIPLRLKDKNLQLKSHNENIDDIVGYK